MPPAAFVAWRFFMNDKQLLAKIESLLVAHIPTCIQAAKIAEPVYSLRVWYHGSDTYGPDRTPGLMLPKEAWRAKQLTEKRDEASYYVWCADELDGKEASLWAKIDDKA